ncbi:MAG: hypothetical protein EOP09_13290, partial [Proteobacteria bacterium]
MSILKALPDGNRLHSTHAYLAKNENGSIYDLFDTAQFHQGLEAAFEFQGYASSNTSTGLGLAIPYPHEELKPDGILASSIEHFAPAIITGALNVRVNDVVLDSKTIEQVAQSVAARIRTEAIRTDIARYLNLIKAALGDNPEIISLDDFKGGFAKLKETAAIRKLQTTVAADQTVVFQIKIPLERNETKSEVSLRAAIKHTPSDHPPMDRLFREGMSLPDVKAKNPGEFDLVILVDDNALATYLNFCEGKAHLDLLESKEIRAKLQEKGYDSGYRVKRFVKSLPVDLRNLLTPESVEPDPNVFDDFFAIADDTPGKGPGSGGDHNKPVPPVPPPPPPAPKPSVLVIETLSNGFRASANPDYEGWPVNVSISMAYADGSRNPDWSEHDFSPANLKFAGSGCDASLSKNVLKAV